MAVESLIGGPFEGWVEQIRACTPDQGAARIAALPELPALLDRKTDPKGTWIYLSEHIDAHEGTAPEFPMGETAEDYLTEFGRYLREHP